MNTNLDLHFFDFTKDDLPSPVSEIVRRERCKIQLRPFNRSAADFVANLSGRGTPFSFFVTAEEIETPVTPGVQTMAEGSTEADVVICFDHQTEMLSQRLMDYVDARRIQIIAPITEAYFQKKPLFLISIPKSGTHLLYQLVESLGYGRGVVFSDSPRPGCWYCLEYSNSHTSARDFFIDTVRRSPFGNRQHPFLLSPALFMYRNPLDILISEANYYHKDGNSPFYGYLANRSFEERIMALIEDPWLLGSIRERIGRFTPWVDFQNVIPVSFEEMIGPQGGGDREAQTKLIWSLQLKLHIPGNPLRYGNRVFNESSPTFHEGRIGSYRDRLSEKTCRLFQSLPQDFMAMLGYDAETVDTVPPIPKRADEFRMRPLKLGSQRFESTPITVEYDYMGHNIVKLRGDYYLVPMSYGGIDLAALDDEVLGCLKHEKGLSEAKARIILGRRWGFLKKVMDLWTRRRFRGKYDRCMKRKSGKGQGQRVSRNGSQK